MQQQHSIRARVTGRVQGVFFRAFTHENAERLGVTGWVRNRPDGSVEALLQHSEMSVLHELLDHLRRGPEASRVDGVEFQEELECEQFSGFSIIR